MKSKLNYIECFKMNSLKFQRINFEKYDDLDFLWACKQKLEFWTQCLEYLDKYQFACILREFEIFQFLNLFHFEFILELYATDVKQNAQIAFSIFASAVGAELPVQK